MACTQGDEVSTGVQTTTASRAANTIHLNKITVDDGVCYNQIKLDITNIQSATAYIMGIYDNDGNLLAQTESLVPVAEFEYQDIPEFTTVGTTNWIGFVSNSALTQGVTAVGSNTRENIAHTFGALPATITLTPTGNNGPRCSLKHDGTVLGTGLTLSGTHATQLLDKKKKKPQSFVIGPKVEQFIPVEFTFNTESTTVRHLKEIVRLRSTLVRNTMIRVELRLHMLKDAIGSTFKVSSPLKKAVESRIEIKGKTLRNLKVRNENIKKFLIRKLDKLMGENDG